MESLLTSCVPQLHAKTLIFHINSFGDEVDSNSRLHDMTDTCSFPVKLSKIKRLIIEVLPTDWSPNITILHFTAGLPYIFKFIYSISCDTTRTHHNYFQYQKIFNSIKRMTYVQLNQPLV